MKAHAIFRLGRDAQINRLSSGESVANLALATNVRKGQEEVTVWVEAALFGKRADSLAPFLLKGKQILADLDGVHLQTYQARDGTTATKLVARVSDITLVGAKTDGGGAQAAAPRQQQAAPAPRPQAPTQAAPPAPSGFDDMDDSMPF